MVQPVRPLIGPFSGRACSNKVCVLDDDLAIEGLLVSGGA